MRSYDEDDDAIVANTVAEICVVLVLLFFLAIGSVLAVTSPADEQSAILPDEPRIEVPANGAIEESSVRAVGDRVAGWVPAFEGSLVSQLNRSGCQYRLSNGRRTLSMLLGAGENAMFEQNSAAPTSYGLDCLRPVCRSLLVEVLKPRLAGRVEVQIDGHASSEWRDLCTPSLAATTGCMPCSDAFDCNLALSMERARSVFNVCRSEVRDVENTSPTSPGGVADRDALFVATFRTKGVSSAELVRGADGTENAARSRRVEFTIRAKRD